MRIQRIAGLTKGQPLTTVSHKFSPHKSIVFFIFPVILLFSCETLPVNHFRNQAWYTGFNAHNTKPVKGPFVLLGVTVDKPEGADSLQKEIEGLVPLYFWEQGYSLSREKEFAGYAADVRVREREYISTWQSRFSISVEVRIWDTTGYSADESGIEQRLPLAAGRVISSGDRSLSSSETVSTMLSLAVKKAVQHLDGGKRSK